MSLSKIQETNTVIGYLQTAEFISEYLLSMKGQPSERKIYCVLAVFELLKLKYRVQKWRQQKHNSIFISETNQIEKLEVQEEERSQQFMQQWSEGVPQQEDIKESLKQSLENLKRDKPKFNLGYQDVLEKSRNRIGVITTLPIPDQFKRSHSSKMSASDLAIQFGEILYLIRPLIHCTLLLIYGSESYKPYLISLIIDIFRYYNDYASIRLVLQRNIQFFRKCEKQEMKDRLQSLFIVYALRNPFYREVLRAKLIDPALGLIFKQNSIFTRLIIQLIEIRSSRSLLL